MVLSKSIEFTLYGSKFFSFSVDPPFGSKFVLFSVDPSFGSIFFL